MNKELTAKLDALRADRTERYAATFDHEVDKDDPVKAKRYNDIESKLAADYDLRALLAEVEAVHQQEIREYEAAKLLLTLPPMEHRAIDVMTAQCRKNEERHGFYCPDHELASWQDGSRTIDGVEGVHYRVIRPQNPEPGPPPLTPDERV
jgi:hypothetical protein